MNAGDWTDAENDLIVADYFAMLAAELAGRPYVKAAHNAALRASIDRSRSSIEFKHQNISAVLRAMGEDWLRGYRPAVNFQTSLVDAVARWLMQRPDWLSRTPSRPPARGLSDIDALWVGPPPTSRNEAPPATLESMLGLARKFDVAGRDERNRALGRAGEECVLARERAVLFHSGRDDLARRVRWISQEDGDGAGYDIASFEPDGRTRLIEVKTTNGWDRTPFHISRNELAVADDRRDEWLIFRLWNFSREPKAFELRPPLGAHVALTPTTFQASFP